MRENESNQSTTRWVKKTFRNLSENEIVEKANEITQRYIKENKERIEKEDKLNQRYFEEAIDKEFLYLKLFGEY